MADKPTKQHQLCIETLRGQMWHDSTINTY